MRVLLWVFACMQGTTSAKRSIFITKVSSRRGSSLVLRRARTPLPPPRGRHLPRACNATMTHRTALALFISFLILIAAGPAAAAARAASAGRKGKKAKEAITVSDSDPEEMATSTSTSPPPARTPPVPPPAPTPADAEVEASAAGRRVEAAQEAPAGVAQPADGRATTD